jgi:hypothetical protein
MRRTALALLLIGLVAPHAVAAPADGRCPTMRDVTGDAALGPIEADAALDLAAIELTVDQSQITAKLRLMGQPDAATVGKGQYYEVYLHAPEGATYLLRASLGNTQARYELLTHTATGPAEQWEHVRDVTGRVERNSVVISASRPRDLLVHGSGQVWGQTWMTAADAPMAVAGLHTPRGFAAGVDQTETRTLVFDKSGPCRFART